MTTIKTKASYLLLGVVIAVVAVSVFEMYKKRDARHGNLSVAQAQAYIGQSFPNAKVSQVLPTKLKRFSAVVTDDRVYYMSRNGRFLLVGTLYDLRNDINLTEDTKIALRKEIITDLNPDNMLTYAPENDQYTMRVFSDVDCPYCRKLHGELETLHKYGVRVDYVLVPYRGEEAKRKAISVWCADDRHVAMDGGMRGEPIKAASCEGHPIDDNLRLARALGVSATPAFLLEDGRLIVGYRPVQDILYELKNPPEPKT